MFNQSELASLLLALGRAGIELAPHSTGPAKLRFKSPGGPADLPPELSARLRVHRGAILGLLASGYAPDAHADGDDAGYVYGERLGVADGLGMPTHPGSAAWLVAVGESMLTLDVSSSCATLCYNGRPQDHPRIHPTERNQSRGTGPKGGTASRHNDAIPELHDRPCG